MGRGGVRGQKHHKKRALKKEDDLPSKKAKLENKIVAIDDQIEDLEKAEPVSLFVLENDIGDCMEKVARLKRSWERAGARLKLAREEYSKRVKKEEKNRKKVLDLQAKREHLFAELRNIETAGGKSGESAGAEPPKTCAICSWPVESNDFFKCKAEHVFCASCMEHAIVNALDFDNAELLPTFICGDAICAMGCGNVVAVKGSAAKESGVLANMIVDRAKGVVTNALKQQRGGGRLDDAVAKARRQAEDIHMGACPGGCGTSMLLGDFEGCLARTCEAQHCLVNFCFACEQVTMCDRHTAQLQSEQEKVDSKQISAIDLYKGVVCVLCRVANHNHCRQCVPGTDSYYLARDMVQGHFLKVKADRAAHIVTSLLSTREEKNAFMQALDSEVRKVVRAKHPMVF